MELTRSIDIDAPPGIVWEVWSDIARWHEWTASITSIDRLGPGRWLWACARGCGSRSSRRRCGK